MTTATEGPPRRRRRKAAVTPEGSEDADAIVNAKTPGKGKAAKPEGQVTPNPPADTPPLFDTAEHQKGFPKAPNMQHGFQTIVTDLFDSGFDVKAEWDAVREGLEIKDALTPERLKRAANGQERLADRAHQLYIVGHVEVSAYMRETEAVYGAIRDSAIQELEKQKANKSRTKQITDADAKTQAAHMYPDEWADICSRREKSSAMLKHLENLSALARSRCYTISSMSSPSSRGV